MGKYTDVCGGCTVIGNLLQRLYGAQTTKLAQRSSSSEGWETSLLLSTLSFEVRLQFDWHLCRFEEWLCFHPNWRLLAFGGVKVDSALKAVWEEVNPDPLTAGPPGHCSKQPPPGWSGWCSVGNSRTGRRPVSPQGRVPRRQVTTSYCQCVFFTPLWKHAPTLQSRSTDSVSLSLTHREV